MKFSRTKLIIGLLTGVLILVLVLVGCAPTPTPTPKPTPTPTPTSKPTPTPTPTPAPVKLPKILTCTTYGVGTSVYMSGIAVGDAMLKKYGVRLRVIPCDGDMDRTMPIRTGEVEFSLHGSGSFAIRRGEFEFGSISWGPQPLRFIWAPVSLVGFSSLVVTATSGIKTPRDLKGKSVAWQAGAPGNITPRTAQLAFAGLTWDDVKIVDVASYAECYQKQKEGKLDSNVGQATSAYSQELAASPYGIYWPEFPPEDKEGWKRLQKYGPFFPYKVEPDVDLPGLKKGEPKWLTNSNYPTIVTYARQNEELVYNIAKMFHELYPEYVQVSKMLMGGFDPKLAVVANHFHPWHEGAVRYFKEQGWWTREMEAAQQDMLNEERKLKEAWDAAITEATLKQVKEKDFRALWEKYRDPILGKDAEWYKIFGEREKLMH